MGEQKVRIDLPLEKVRVIAARKAHGASLRELESEFNLSRIVINRVLRSDEAKQTIKDVTYAIVVAERAVAQRGVAELLPLAVEVVKDKLEKGELKAAEMVFKAAGLLQQQEDKGPAQSQGITVILPGQAPQPKTVDAETIEVSDG